MGIIQKAVRRQDALSIFRILNSWSILPTGQSIRLVHYSDQAALYNAGKFRRMLLNKDEIVRTSTKLLFIPGKNCL
jgi:penicillin amidase